MQITIDSITKCLTNHLDDDAALKVLDESHLHYGHHEADGVTHISVTLVWGGFNNMKTIDRHRLLNTWLSDFFKKGLHSVACTLKTPSEVLR